MQWEKLFSNSVSFNEINIEEKDEFGRYVYELPLEGLTPRFPLGLIEGQYIEETFAQIFFPVKTITDFNKLPIPFLCMAADIVKGEPVVLNKGSLAAAVRASMSIPTVFSPVRIDGRLLVDGGVYVNLPITYCRNMGADFIIAVDVGGGLMKEEELTSAASLLMQTAFLAGDLSYQSERNKSDIFIDVVSHLKYSTMDFEHGADMMQSGDVAVKEVMPSLVALANKLKPYPVRQVKRITRFQHKYHLELIGMDGVSDENSSFVLEKFGYRQGDHVSRDEMTNGVHQLMGTRLFDKVSYSIEGDSAHSVLTIRAKEKPVNAVKFAIHYDTDRGAGLILNFTKRNLVLPSSRFITTIDLAENPGIRVNYFYYIGKHSRWWHFTELYTESVAMNSFVEGTPVPDIVNGYAFTSTALNYSLSSKSYVGFGGYGYQSELRPKIDPRDEQNPSPISIMDYRLKTYGAEIHYRHNSWDRVFFPSRGTLIGAEGSLHVGNPVSADFFVASPDTTYTYSLTGAVQNYLKLNLKLQRNVYVSGSSTVLFKLQSGLMQEISSNASKLSAYRVAAGDFVAVGGQLYRPRSDSFTFIGLREAELSVPQILMLGAQWQYSPSKNMYLIPGVNILAAGYDSSDFWSTLGNFDFSNETTDGAFYQFGYGLTAAYMSLLGPIQVTVSSNAQVNKLRWFLNIGFNF
jgi:NTE family protein